jgi:hypothetical protein
MNRRDVFPGLPIRKGKKGTNKRAVNSEGNANGSEEIVAVVNKPSEDCWRSRRQWQGNRRRLGNPRYVSATNLWW